ncbi:MAG: bifunctional oligoribonuclease/PAP phosphatase NrnA [Clostridia bacterium]|nr:bifunctional oligoribonuclease/PAP phosphatase NrnA [Clostridia bacterium]
MYTKFVSGIKSSNSFAIFTHINPDGDALGSSLAVFTFLRSAGKTAHLFLPNDKPIPPKLGFLPNVEEFNNFTPLSSYDCAIALDCGDASRLSDENFKLFLKAKTRMVVDHHQSHEAFAPITILEADSASTTQIVFKILKACDPKYIDKDVALQLYTGLVTDSGSFSYTSTSPETHKVAAELLSYGIDAGFVSRKVMKDTPFSIFNLKNRVLAKTKFFEDFKIAFVSYIDEDFEATSTTEADTEGIINNILDIDTVEIAISLAEIKDKAYKVSIRTKQNVNAAAIAKVFGGGGHANAAGCRVYGYFEDVCNKILSAATEMLKYA